MKLHEAVRNKNHSLVADILKEHMTGSPFPTVNLNEKDEQGNTGIHLAALANDMLMVQIILAAGPSLDIRNNQEKLANEITTDEEIRQLLIEAELPVAAWNKNLAQVKQLIANGHQPNNCIFVRMGIHNHEIRKVSALTCANFKSLEIKTYLDKVMRLIKDEFGLAEAIKEGDIDIVTALVKFHKHNVNAVMYAGSYSRFNGKTPLAYAITQNQPAIVCRLMELGADKTHFEVTLSAKLSKNNEIRALFDLPPYSSELSEVAPISSQAEKLAQSLIQALGGKTQQIEPTQEQQAREIAKNIAHSLKPM